MRVYDASNMSWTFDKSAQLLYCLDAEGEMLMDGVDLSQNGYPCYSWQEAIELLNKWGYMEGAK